MVKGQPLEPAALDSVAPLAVDWLAVGVVVGVLAALLLAYYLSIGRQACARFATGLRLGLLGLLAKELRSRSRGWRPMWVLTFYLLVMAAGVAGFLALARKASGTVMPTTGTLLYFALAVGSVMLLAFITPALTSGAISGERERRTLELLLVTRASALGLVTGKLLGSLFYILFLLFASLPAFALVYLFGGVPPFYLGMTLAVATVTAVAHASLGLLLSAVLKRTVVASVIAYLLVILVVIGLPFLSAASAVMRGDRSTEPPPVYMSASPIVSLSSVLTMGQPGSSAELGQEAMRFLFAGGRSTIPSSSVPITQVVYVVGYDEITNVPKTVVRWAPWVYHFAFSGAFTLFCLLASALALAPVKPWRAWRRRRRSRQPALSRA